MTVEKPGSDQTGQGVSAALEGVQVSGPTSGSDAAQGNLVALTDEDIQAGLEAEMEVVEPILSELFRHAAEEQDFWLKKRSLKYFANWLLTTINVLQMQQQALEQMGRRIQQLETENAQLEGRKKLFVPGV